MAPAHENHAAPAPDNVDQAAAALEELAADFGVRVLVLAMVRAGYADNLRANPTDTLRVIQFLLREIVFSKNPQLEAEIMAIASGVLDEKGVGTRVAEKHGIGRAAVSKRAVAFCEEWKLPPGPTMKSVAARKKFAGCNKPREGAAA